MNNEMTVKQMLDAAGPVSRFVPAQTAELIMGLATAVRQLTEQRDAVVAEMKLAFEKPQAYLSWHAVPPTWEDPLPCGEYLDVHDTDEHKNSDGTGCWPVYAKPETSATDAAIAALRAEVLPTNIAEIIDSGDLEPILFASEASYSQEYRMAFYNFRQLRESKGEVQS